MSDNIDRIEFPMPDWTKKWGYIKWHQRDDVIIRKFFGEATDAHLKIANNRPKTRTIEYKRRRIGLAYSNTRALPKNIQKVVLTKHKGDIIKVDFV